MNLAKQSTAKTFILGPILDADGAAKTDEVVASIKVTKNGSVGSPNGSSTLTHDHTGHYLYAANAGDFDTLGEVEFSLNSGTNAMAPVVFQVVPSAVYDSLVSGTDYLPVDTTQWGGASLPTEFAASNMVTLPGDYLSGAEQAALAAAAAGTWYSAPTIPTASSIADAVLDEAKGDHTGFIVTLALEATAQAVLEDTSTTLPASIAELSSHGDATWTGSVAPQVIRDAMKLAPTAGTPAAGSVDKHLDDIQSQTDLMVSGALPTVVSNVSAGGTLNIAAGASYLDTDDNALEISVSEPNDPASVASLAISDGQTTDELLTVEGTFVQDGDDWIAKFDLTAAQTATLAGRFHLTKQRWDLMEILPNGDPVAIYANSLCNVTKMVSR